MSPRAYRVRYLRHAEEDLYQIYDYICRDSPHNAARFLHRLDKDISSLADHPARGRRVRDRRLRDRGYRFVTVGAYVVLYKVENTDVVVYRVVHGARDWSRLL